MARGPWVIRGPVLLGIAVALVAYSIIAEAVGLVLLGFRGSSESGLYHRLGECALLWTLLCSAAGWLSVLRKRPPGHDARSWPIVIVPIAIGVWLSAIDAWGAYQDGSLTDPVLGGHYTSTLCGCVVSILLLTGGLSGALWVQSFFWRRFGRVGVCYECRYDLRGLVSNRCPECGMQIAEDGSSRPPGSPRWYPELLLFDTARQRDEAWQSAWKQLNRRPRNWCWWVLVFLPTICVLGPLQSRLGSWYWPVLGFVGALSATGFLIRYRMQRRMLRGRLLAAGIRVCLKCGHDLREVESPYCPECGEKLEESRPPAEGRVAAQSESPRERETC